MITSKTGDLLAEPAEALVNTVNCVGIMGRGVALQFRNAFPENYRAYKAACDRGEVQPGRMFVFELGQLTRPRWIINFPTKRHWRGKSRMEDIEAGLVALVQEIRTRGIRSIALPPLGSGLGGLDWRQVKPRIIAALGPLEDLEVTVFDPAEPPAEARGMAVQDVPRMTPGRAALVGLIHRYLGGLMDPFVTLLEVHKLMYFMQAAGEPLRLRYAKALYGPYAENLGKVLAQVEGHLVAGYRDGGDAPDKELSLVPGAVEDAVAFLDAAAETRARFDRVARLVEGFETPFGLELLSTVHWVALDAPGVSPEEIVRRVHAWNERKRRFSPRQITLALETLTAQGWLERQAA
ncbi:type II toxin-antitoxin system antitoxin DNA ADP-ribosyl glycohydrolase DarG [Roseomonas rosulenta]|uniref:type II toxin-antitoxin system antitoxin DNA ADP-ribosyl glycohydrolase DarG n=1 Tax=Roseomonas rosulenta TaxID=2748667 RepID=UPI0018DF3449|nr:macro domain-containing protein [Roseomonas rosulenta]